MKSSTKVKPVYIQDLAVQLYVMRELGHDIDHTKLMYVNSSYIYQGGEYSLDEYFISEDQSEKVDKIYGEVSLRLDQFRKILSNLEPPQVEVRSHCRNPNNCPFNDHCRQGHGKDHITKLYRIGDKKLDELRSIGVRSIKDIPDDFKLSITQERIRAALGEGKAFVSEEVKPQVQALEFPLYFLDFETSNPALPLFPQTSPWKQVPFQWLIHILQKDGSMTHKEFLPAHKDDPRPDFTKALIDSLDDRGSVVVYYENFEKSIIEGLAQHFSGEIADRLRQINSRVFDLYQLVFDHVYDPEFGGSFSIKKVLPALVPHLSYKGMGIADGAAALIAYQKLLNPGINKDDERRIRNDLLAYCKLDTLAMVEIYKVLKKISC